MTEKSTSPRKTVDNNQSTTVQQLNFGSCDTLPMAFAGYSMNVMVQVVARRLNMTYWTGKSSARVVRVLWFMRMMGCGWVSEGELAAIGSGHWTRLRWIIPDGIKDGLIEQMQVGRWIKFRPTEAGKAFVEEAERYVIEEHQRSLSKIEAWKAKKRRVAGKVLKTA